MNHSFVHLPAPLAVVASGLLCALATSACFNDNDARNVTVEARRFETAVGAPVHGGRQLLVDAATGDLWYLDVPRSSDDGAQWKLWARGPEDVTPIEQTESVENQVSAFSQPD